MSIHTDTINNLEHRPNLNYQANSIITGGHNPMSDQENQENKDTQQIESEQTESELFSKEQTLQLGGYSPLPRIIRQAKGLSLAAKTVYALLVDYYWNSNGSPIRCLQEKMCLELGDIDRSVLLRHLKELRKYGLISWERKGLPARNIYTLCTYPQHLVDKHLQHLAVRQDATNQPRQDVAIRNNNNCRFATTNIKVFKDQRNILSPLNPPKSSKELIDHICDMLPKITKPLSYLEESGITQIFLKHGGALSVEFVAKAKSIHGKYASYDNLIELISSWGKNGKTFEGIGNKTQNGNSWRRSTNDESLAEKGRRILAKAHRRPANLKNDANLKKETDDDTVSGDIEFDLT